MDVTGFRASTTVMKVQVLFANWAPSCRALVDNVSEWFTCLQAGEHPWDCRIIHGFSRVLVLLGCWGGSRHEQVSCFCMDLRGMVVVWVVDNSEVEIDEITGF